MIIAILSILVLLFVGVDIVAAVAINDMWRTNFGFRINILLSRGLYSRIIRSAVGLLDRRPAVYMTSLIMCYCAAGIVLYTFA